MKQVSVHALLAGRDGIEVKEINMAEPLRFSASLFIKEPHFLDQSVLAELRLEVRIGRPPVEVSHEQRHALATAGRTAVSEAASLVVEPVSS